MIILNYCNILPNELDGKESNANLQLVIQKAKYKKRRRYFIPILVCTSRPAW